MIAQNDCWLQQLAHSPPLRPQPFWLASPDFSVTFDSQEVVLKRYYLALTSYIKT